MAKVLVIYVKLGYVMLNLAKIGYLGQTWLCYVKLGESRLFSSNLVILC